MSLINQPLFILFGGPSSEREVSIDTALFFSKLYKELKPIEVEWGNDGKFHSGSVSYTETEFLEYAKTARALVLIASHGEFLEDGYIQEKFENNGILFTGSDSLSCKLAMDKIASQKKVYSLVKTIPTTRDHRSLELPFVAKPYNLGSSVGVYLIKDKSDLSKYKRFFTDNYVYQPYIRGVELSHGCVRSGKKFMPLFPTEIIPKHAFFDYDSKYVKGGSREITPARINQDLTKNIMELTNRIRDLHGLGYYSRTDYILADNGELYYLEINALPGMTPTSLLPQQLRQAGLMEEFKRGLLKNPVFAKS